MSKRPLRQWAYRRIQKPEGDPPPGSGWFLLAIILLAIALYLLLRPY